jgi:hypothetical protein
VIEDVLRRTRTDVTALTFIGAQRLGLLVAPPQIDAEVCERLPEVAQRTGCSVKLAQAMYEAIHRPLIRFVDVPDLSIDERVAAVAKRDSDDAPLAYLATLLAPLIVLTSDSHLIAEGIGHGDWLKTILLLRDLAQIDAMLWSGGRVAWLGVDLPMRAGDIVVRQLARSEVAQGLALGLVVGAVLYLRPQLRSAVRRRWARVEPVVTQLWNATVEGLEKRAEAERALRLRLVMAGTPPPAEAAAARLLAEHGGQLASAEIHKQLQRRGHDVSLTATRTVLRDHPAFVSIPGCGYQLGRSLPASSANAPHPAGDLYVGSRLTQ